MDKNNGTAAKGGVGFLGLLTLLFIGLKLTGYIDWAWGWVLAPLWISLALFVFFVTVCVIVELVKNR